MFKQNLNAMMKVTNMVVKETSTEKGEFIILETKGTLLPSGVLATVSKLIKLPIGHEFVQSKVDAFKDMIADFDKLKAAGANYYVSVSVYPKKDKLDKNKFTQFDKIKTDVSPDGKEYFKIEAFVEPLKVKYSPEGEDEIILEYKNGDVKNVKVSEISEKTYSVSMYCVAFDENLKRVELSSGGDFPTTLVVYQSESQKGVPKIGQLYDLELLPTKGKKVAGKKITEMVADWDNEEDIKVKSTFEPDKLITVVVKRVDGEMMPGLGGDSSDPLDAMMKMLG